MYLAELRLQKLESLNLDERQRQAGFFDMPKVHRAGEVVSSLVAREVQEYDVI